MYRYIVVVAPSWWLLAACLLAAARAGPLPGPPPSPLPPADVTDVENGLKEGSCTVGDVVYLPGDEVPGASACETCRCARGALKCSTQQCEPRPGCKALHRQDSCCPIYQCECELDGRVYGNGEKLVDPLDPCKVCYCQGGEVVCRRIACFVRDDCRPRNVTGRCCPEYDNCPLGGITTIPGIATSMASITPVSAETNPSVLKENIKQEITIKEITPVSEIPVITEVKIKEIISSPSIEVAEYTSSKSPVIQREATTDRPSTPEELDSTPKLDAPSVTASEIKTDIALISSTLAPDTGLDDFTSGMKSAAESFPSKISLSTQDYINSEIYPGNSKSTITELSSTTTATSTTASSTKAPIIEEEDTSLLDHNPAFPPIPDDLTVLRNHDDEIVPEYNADMDHSSIGHEIVRITTVAPSTDFSIVKHTTLTEVEKIEKVITFTATTESTTENEATETTTKTVKESPMLDLRSAIPTEILNVPSIVPEDINGELDDVTEDTVSSKKDVSSVEILTNRDVSEKSISKEFFEYTPTSRENDSILEDDNVTLIPEVSVKETMLEERTTNEAVKFDTATHTNNQTEISSLPIETSDQNPQDTLDSDAIIKPSIEETSEPATVSNLTTFTFSEESTAVALSSTLIPTTGNLTTKIDLPIEEITTSITEKSITSEGVPLTTEKVFYTTENSTPVTEAVTSTTQNRHEITEAEPELSSGEASTDAVELFQPTDSEQDSKASLIDATASGKNNVLTDLIKLVGDVASISNHTEGPDTPTAASTAFSESEEIIPVNAGYKSKNNNKNINTIAASPGKSKTSSENKQKIELEDEESESVTDHSPNDRKEPTTKRPIIDNVSDDKPGNRTDKKDIEIITQSYVPSIVQRRPTKQVMKKHNERPAAEETTTPSSTAPVTSVAPITSPAPFTSPAPVTSPASATSPAHAASPSPVTTGPI